jgi:hypothetical protein
MRLKVHRDSLETKIGEGTMSVLESDTAACPTSAEAQEFAHPVSWGDGNESNLYSPVSCILLLLIVGLMIKIGPTIHAYPGS